MSSSGAEDLVARMRNILKTHETERPAIDSPQSRYQMLDEISRGGMSVIRRAWDRRLGRQVAIKILLCQAEGEPEAHARFFQEAKLAANLSHPHIVAIYDSGKLQDQPYIAMQLVDGTTVGKARLGRTDIILALLDIARALQYAHENRVVHRDVKPANILVDKEGHAYLTDFGVARWISVSPRMTLPGIIFGTASYMSPEQARGLPDVDHRTDVYSLGATLFELMSGTPPFSGADSMEVLRKVAEECPPRPRTVHRSTPKEIETIILKAMEKDPEKRYQTAAELADDLQRYLDGDPILARRPGFLYLGWKKARRRPMSAVAVVLAVALLSTLAFVVADSRHQRRMKLMSAYNSISERINAGLLEGVKDELEALKGEFPDEIRIPDLWTALEGARQKLDDEEARKRQQSLSAEVERIQHLLKEEKTDEARSRLADLGKTHPDKDLDYLSSQISIVEENKLNKRLDEVRKAAAEKNVEMAKSLLAHFKPDYPEDKRVIELELLIIAAEYKILIGKLWDAAEKGDMSMFDETNISVFDSRFDSETDRIESALKAILALTGKLRGRGEFTAAAGYLLKATRLEHEKSEIWDQLAEVYLALQEYSKAEEAMKEWSRIQRTEPRKDFRLRLLVGRGLRARERGEWEAAFGLLNQALTLEQGHAEAMLWRGIARFIVRNETEECIQDVEKALALDPKLKPPGQYAQACLGSAAKLVEGSYRKTPETRAADCAKAREQLDRARKIGPSLKMSLLRAVADLWLKEYPAAIADSTAALREGEEAAAVYLLRAQIYSLMSWADPRPERRLEQALEDLGSALEIDPDNMRLVYWTAVVRSRLFEVFNSATRNGKTAERRPPVRLELRKQALDDCKRALRYGPSNGDLETRIAASHLQSDPLDHEAAIRLAGEALGKTSMSEDEFLARGGGDYELARRLLERDACWIRGHAYAIKLLGSKSRELFEALKRDLERVMQLPCSDHVRKECEDLIRDSARRLE